MSTPRSSPARFTIPLIALGLISILVPHTLWAQEHASFRSLAVVAGPANYDLSGTGWSWSAAARLEVPLGRVLLLEPGLGFFTYNSQFADRVSLLLPEVSLQLQYPGARVRPYLGVGGGAAFVLQGPGGTEPSVHAAAGVRLDVASSWGVRGEARLRNLTVFEANSSIFEFVVGVSRRF